MTARNKDHGVVGRQASGATGGSFHETPQASNGGIMLATERDWSTDPRVIVALGEGPELDDDQKRLLNVLLDPGLDEYADPDDLLEQFEGFGSWSGSDIREVAYRVELQHLRDDGAHSWVFQYIDDDDSGWFEVGSYLPGSMSHVTQGEDGKYLARAGDGLRGAIEAAAQIDDLWQANRRTMREKGLLGERLVLDEDDKAALREMAADAAAEWEEFEYRSRQRENGYTAEDIADYRASMERQQALLRKLGVEV